MDIFEKLKAKIVEKIDCDPSKVTRDTSLIGLGIDSLDTVEMIMDLEEELGVEPGLPMASWLRLYPRLADLVSSLP